MQTVVGEENGRSLNEKSLQKASSTAFSSVYTGKILISIVSVKAAVTRELLSQSGIKDLVASYCTYFNEGDTNRNTNIKVAVECPPMLVQFQ